MKTLEFIYQESEIHFLVNGADKNVMINASEMAKVFGKRTDHFIKTDHAKAFVEALKSPPNGGDLDDESIISHKGRNGIYYHRALALKFAAWLDPNFEVWIFTKIEDLVFGNYKKHWEAHAREEEAKKVMQELREKLLINPTTEMVRNYFEAEREAKAAKNDKTNAIKNQLRLF